MGLQKVLLRYDVYGVIELRLQCNRLLIVERGTIRFNICIDSPCILQEIIQFT
jgi:hypothetical protein